MVRQPSIEATSNCCGRNCPPRLTWSSSTAACSGPIAAPVLCPGNSLNRAPVPPIGEKGRAPETLADGFGEAIGLAVDREQRIAYVADLSGKIWAIPAPGTTHTEVHVVVDLGFAVTGLNLVKD